MKKNSFVNRTFITNTFEETQKLGNNLAKNLEGGDIVYLYGDLGSGKTTFTQGLAEGLGIKQRIISPTFVIVRQHKVSPPRSPIGSPRCEAGHLGGGETATSTPARCNTFYHIDLYRINNEKDLEGLGIEEIIKNKNNIAVIEWAEKMGKMLPKKRIDIHFKYLDGNRREITIKNKYGRS